jgi:hypothetical protein
MGIPRPGATPVAIRSRTTTTTTGGDVVAVQKGTTGESWARDNVPAGVQVRPSPVIGA